MKYVPVLRTCPSERLTVYLVTLRLGMVGLKAGDSAGRWLARPRRQMGFFIFFYFYFN